MIPCLLGAQPQDTVNLYVGNPSVDGRIYQPHVAAVVVSTVKNDRVVQTVKYRSRTFLTTRMGIPVCVVTSEPYADSPDQKLRGEVVLNQRTMALIHIEQQDGSGRSLVANVDGRHVTGTLKRAEDSTSAPFDFTLDSESYYFPFLDAAVGATPMHIGQVYRAPTFGFGDGQRKTEWHTVRLTKRDSVTVLGKTSYAWLLEDTGPLPQRIWITDEPPYLPLVLTPAPDGSTRRFESALLPPGGQ
jgi:hypothetical protein